MTRFSHLLIIIKFEIAQVQVPLKFTFDFAPTLTPHPASLPLRVFKEHASYFASVLLSLALICFCSR
jgi:hypothetical protein